jgi:hypothetical protein
VFDGRTAESCFPQQIGKGPPENMEVAPTTSLAAISMGTRASLIPGRLFVRTLERPVKLMGIPSMSLRGTRDCQGTSGLLGK